MYTTDAIVLTTRPLGETDELISFYTRKCGKLIVRARGTKKVSSKQAAFLHEPALVECGFIATRAGYLLSGIKNIRAYPAISRNLYAFGYLLSFFALCDQLFYEGEKDEAMWQLFVNALEDTENSRALGEMEQGEYLWRKEKLWLLALLNVLGVKPNQASFDSMQTSQHLDVELKQIFEQRFNRPIIFFGLRTFGHWMPHA